MSGGQGTWHTPVSVLRHYEKIWQNLEKKGWKTEVDLTNQPSINFFDTTSSRDYNQYKSEYDQFFSYGRQLPLWDQRKPKDNVQCSRDIHENVFQQEMSRPVPAMSSLDYARPFVQFYDFKEYAYRRVNYIKDFYRSAGELKRPFVEKEPQ